MNEKREKIEHKIQEIKEKIKKAAKILKQHFSDKMFVIIILIVILLGTIVGSVIGRIVYKNKSSEPVANILQETAVPAVTPEPEIIPPAETEIPIQETSESQKNMALLEPSLLDLVNQYDGVWSVYIKNLQDDSEVLIHDSEMKSASVMKLFIMGATYEKVNEGILQEAEIEDTVSQMIIESDNISANELLLRLGDNSYEKGIKKVNDFIEAHGYNHATVEYNGFEDPDSFIGHHSNITSVRDCGTMLEDIYKGECISPQMSAKMLDLLKRQKTDYKIAYQMPEDVIVANKSGEMDDVENDVGIIYSQGGDYILCVLSSEWTNSDTAISNIQEITKVAYDFFNSEE